MNAAEARAPRAPRACTRCTLICFDSFATHCDACEARLPDASRKRPREEDVVDLTGESTEGGSEEEVSSAGSHAAQSSAHATHTVVSHKDCPICLDPLGTNGGVQALGCMDAFCRECIATHVLQKLTYGDDVQCPLCKRTIPRSEQLACGPGKPLTVSDSDDSDDEEEEDEGEGEGSDSSDDEGEEGHDGEHGEDGEQRDSADEEDGGESDDSDDSEDNDDPEQDILLQQLLFQSTRA